MGNGTYDRYWMQPQPHPALTSVSFLKNLIPSLPHSPPSAASIPKLAKLFRTTAIGGSCPAAPNSRPAFALSVITTQCQDAQTSHKVQSKIWLWDSNCIKYCQETVITGRKRPTYFVFKCTDDKAA